MQRLIVLALMLVGSIGFADRAFAQQGAGAAGRTEITVVPGGALFFTENKETSAPGFGNYQLGAAVTVNVSRVIGVEAEIGSTVGMSQNLDFGYSSTVRTPDVLTYSGNLVVSMPTGSSVVPYVTGGAGGLSVFSREELGITESDTRLAGNVGGGIKWYSGRWGLRGDYRFLAVRASDSGSPFFGTERRYGHRVYGAVLLNVGR